MPLTVTDCIVMSNSITITFSDPVFTKEEIEKTRMQGWSKAVTAPPPQEDKAGLRQYHSALNPANYAIFDAGSVDFQQPKTIAAFNTGTAARGPFAVPTVVSDRTITITFILGTEALPAKREFNSGDWVNIVIKHIHGLPEGGHPEPELEGDFVMVARQVPGGTEASRAKGVGRQTADPIPRTITKEMLATALQRLEALETNETTVLANEQLRERAEEVAEAALAAIAVCLKYVLATYGDATLDGFGTFVVRNGGIEFLPRPDVLQYALLKHRDEATSQQALRDAFARTLTLADSIIPVLDLTETQTTSVGVDQFHDERVMQFTFDATTPNRFETTVSAILSRIVQRLSSAGIEISLRFEDPEEVSTETATPYDEVEKWATKERQSQPEASRDAAE